MLDYHIHTKLCRHASGEMEAYIEHALTQPLKEIGFSDHLPMVKWAHPEYAMRLEELPVYVNRVRQLRQAYPQLPIKLGIEADYFAGEEAATQALLSAYPFDYVYGSVHMLDGWAIDDERNLDKWAAADVNAIYEQYFTTLQHAARSGLFDIITHTDLVKKFGHKPTRDFSALIEHTIRVYKECQMAVEINTSGLRKPAQEFYPAPQILRWLKQYEIPIVFGSDAHRPQEVGKDFDFARKIAYEAGFTEVIIFEQRKIVGTYPL